MNACKQSPMFQNSQVTLKSLVITKQREISQKYCLEGITLERKASFPGVGGVRVLVHMRAQLLS